jgi:hypothetical protein
MSSTLATRNRSRLIVIAVIVLLVIDALVGWKVVDSRNDAAREDRAAAAAAKVKADAEAKERAVLADASETCGIGDLEDDDQTLIIQATGAQLMLEVQCLYQNLDTPARVISHINQTRALDGRQEDTWDGIDAAWTYHPQDGLNMTLNLDR